MAMNILFLCVFLVFCKRIVSVVSSFNFRFLFHEIKSIRARCKKNYACILYPEQTIHSQEKWPLRKQNIIHMFSCFLVFFLYLK